LSGFENKFTKITQLFYILNANKLNKLKSRKLFPVRWFYILFFLIQNEIHLQFQEDKWNKIY